MRKILNLIMFSFLCMSLTCISNVEAVSHGYSNSYDDACVNEGTCLFMCGYDISVKVTADYVKDAKYDKFSSYLYYNFEDNTFFTIWLGQETELTYALNKADITKRGIFFQDATKKAFTNSGVCPEYSYADRSSLSPDNEICFDNDRNECTEVIGKNWNGGTDFKGNSTLEYDYTTLISTYFNSMMYEDWGCLDFDKDKISDKIVKDFQTNFLHGNKVPVFIENNPKYQKGMDSIPAGIEAYAAKCTQEIEQDPNITPEQKEAYKENLNVTQEEVKEEIKEAKSEMKTDAGNLSIGNNYNKGNNCEGVLGTGFVKLLKDILSFIQYLGPILVVVLSIMDYIKAAAAAEDGAVKKVTLKMGKRIIAAIALFFVPLLINIIIGFFNSDWASCV